MKLDELKKMIAEEFESYMKEDDVDVSVGADDVDAEMDKNPEDALEQIYKMLQDYFEGDGEDNDSVQVQISSNHINEIRHLVSGKVLEVLTNTAEFYLKPPVGKPVTPSDIQVIRQSSLGSQRKAKPRLFDGATVFVQNNGKTVREYLFSSSLDTRT